MIERNNFDQFEALLLNKEYAQLSAKELDFITLFCDSQKEFEQMKKVSLNVGFVEERLPDPGIKNRLLEHLKAQKQPKHGWVGWNSSFPLWSLFTVALFSSLITFFFAPKKTKIQKINQKVLQIDTIKQTIFQTDTIYIKSAQENKQQPIAKSKLPNKKGFTLVSTHEQKPPAIIKLTDTQKKPANYSQGRSLKQETDLKKFIVRMD